MNSLRRPRTQHLSIGIFKRCLEHALPTKSTCVHPARGIDDLPRSLPRTRYTDTEEIVQGHMLIFRIMFANFVNYVAHFFGDHRSILI